MVFPWMDANTLSELRRLRCIDFVFSHIYEDPEQALRITGLALSQHKRVSTRHLQKLLGSRLQEHTMSQGLIIRQKKLLILTSSATLPHSSTWQRLKYSFRRILELSKLTFLRGRVLSPRSLHNFAWISFTISLILR